ncbi:TetR family transcriptional regulator [Gordonia sp. (in: high G+C Gram-positive bacteria)]|uniref:TetR/AcrR family transcriptional regulator n=1 Tax=Gordonia sp. (in: high G+C Gram-positive bacteria) TaxID=84139 RepID=UPI00169A4B02|nr:TetR family transcriptional regulator [Gordonia sp. (in: high G+C Gram-positive bacteria)]NLG48412.1 TetR/AcrR family transcriptional regulator [Gordonia sp. (in: high G+C Gram-positive bacteria)]
MFSEHVHSGRRMQRELTAQRVIASAQMLFRRDGFRSTTIRAIAADAEVSVGTVMAVGDKDALLLACYDRWIGAVHADRDAGRLAEPPGLTPQQRIGELIAPFLDLFSEDLPLAREYGSVLARGSHHTEVFADLAISLVDAFTEVFRDAGLGSRATAAGRAVYLAYLGLLMATAAAAVDTTGIRSQLEDVADVLLGGAG